MAYEDYLNGMKYKDIAKKYDTTINTVKSWARRYGWSKKGAHKSKGVHTKKVAKKQAEKIAENMIYENGELDEERQLFCIYYLRYHNATKAYQLIRPQVTYGSAMVRGSRLLNEPLVQETIKKLKQEMLADAMLDPVEIFQKYIDIAFLDKNELDGKAITMSDCLKALDWLSKHMSDDTDDSHNDGFIEALEGKVDEVWEE